MSAFAATIVVQRLLLSRYCMERVLSASLPTFRRPRLPDPSRFDVMGSSQPAEGMIAGHYCWQPRLNVRGSRVTRSRLKLGLHLIQAV